MAPRLPILTEDKQHNRRQETINATGLTQDLCLNANDEAKPIQLVSRTSINRDPDEGGCEASANISLFSTAADSCGPPGETHVKHRSCFDGRMLLMMMLLCLSVGQAIPNELMTQSDDRFPYGAYLKEVYLDPGKSAISDVPSFKHSSSEEKRAATFDPIMYGKRRAVFDPIMYGKKRAATFDPILYGKKRAATFDPIMYGKRKAVFDPIMYGKKRAATFDPILYGKRKAVFDPIMYGKRAATFDPILYGKRKAVFDPIMYGKKRAATFDPIMYGKRAATFDPILYG